MLQPSCHRHRWQHVPLGVQKGTWCPVLGARGRKFMLPFLGHWQTLSVTLAESRNESGTGFSHL